MMMMMMMIDQKEGSRSHGRRITAAGRRKHPQEFKGAGMTAAWITASGVQSRRNHGRRNRSCRNHNRIPHPWKILMTEQNLMLSKNNSLPEPRKN